MNKRLRKGIFEWTGLTIRAVSIFLALLAGLSIELPKGNILISLSMGLLLIFANLLIP